MKIGAMIKQNREAQGLTQTDLAEKLFISRQAVSKWENGKAMPSIDNIILISDLLDVSLDQLVKGDEQVMETIKSNRHRETLIKIFLLALPAALLLKWVFGGVHSEAYSNVMDAIVMLQLIVGVIFFWKADLNKLRKDAGDLGYYSLLILLFLVLLTMAYPFVDGFIQGFVDGFNGSIGIGGVWG